MNVPGEKAIYKMVDNEGVGKMLKGDNNKTLTPSQDDKIFIHPYEEDFN